MGKLKRIFSNEYIKSIIFLAIVLGGIAVFWFGIKAYLQTEYPLLAVASGSMVPTLQVGDLIVVQGGLEVTDLNAAYETGDIIVFRKPGNPDELIVHRAVEAHSVGDDMYVLTRGDHNSGVDPWRIYDSHLVGKVVSSLPLVGHIPLFVHSPQGMVLIVILIAVLIVLEFVIPSTKNETEPEPAEEPIVEENQPTADSPADS
jgi:signal peptidase